MGREVHELVPRHRPALFDGGAHSDQHLHEPADEKRGADSDLLPKEISGPTSGHEVTLFRPAVKSGAALARADAVPGEKLLAAGSSDHLPLLHIFQTTLNPARDAGKTVQQLIMEGVFHDRRSPQEKTAANAPNAPIAKSEKNGRPPEIVVQLQGDGKPDGAQPAPDFAIRKDGTIEVRRNVDLNNQKQIVVAIERASGQVDGEKNSLNDTQSKSQTDLLDYLSRAIKQAHPQAVAAGVVLRDGQDLVSKNVESGLNIRNASPLGVDYSNETQHAVERLSRFRGMRHGSISHDGADQYFPRRDVPYQRGESHAAAAFKDTVAALFNADHDHAYETVRHTKSGGYAVGRYGLTDHHVKSWLSSLLGHPIDYAKLPDMLAKLEREGKLPKGFADQFSDPEQMKKLQDFIAKLDGNKGAVTGAEVNAFMPKELQETIATDLSKKYVEAARGDTGTAALAWLKGKGVGDLNQADLSDPGSLQIKDAANKAYSLSVGKMMSGKDDQIQFRDGGDGSPLGIQIARSAQHVALSMGSVGWCKTGVRQALEPFGIHLQGEYAKQSAAQLANNSRVQEVSPADLRPGDILVHQPAGFGRTKGQRYAGHIAVYLGHGMEASDHVQHLIRGQGYGGTRIFRVVS